jgi:hypothetical protein
LNHSRKISFKNLPHFALARFSEPSPAKDHAVLAFSVQGLQDVKLVVVAPVANVGLHQLRVEVTAHRIRSGVGDASSRNKEKKRGRTKR